MSWHRSSYTAVFGNTRYWMGFCAMLYPLCTCRRFSLNVYQVTQTRRTVWLGLQCQCGHSCAQMRRWESLISTLFLIKLMEWYIYWVFCVIFTLSVEETGLHLPNNPTGMVMLAPDKFFCASNFLIGMLVLYVLSFSYSFDDGQKSHFQNSFGGWTGKLGGQSM